MTERVDLTDKKMKGMAAAASGTRYEVADLRVPGLRLRVSDQVNLDGKARSVSFVLYARFPPSQKPTRRTLGTYPAMSLADAREAARGWKTEIERGTDPKAKEKAERDARQAADAEAKVKTFDAAADAFLKRYVEGEKKLRSAPLIRRSLALHVRPTLGQRAIASIRRSDVAALLDKVQDNAGPVAADKVLAHLSKLFNWWATREDGYSSPIVKGMGRSNPTDRARTRKLSDAEIKAVWNAAGKAKAFGAFIRVSLLTGQRRAKVAGMRWADVAADATWTIPSEAREKGSAGELVLSGAAKEIITNQPQRKGNPYVFAGRGDAAIAGFSKAKLLLDKEVSNELGHDPEPWTLHDLRRTAKSLMARAGVRPHVSERVLGHVIAGVEGIYDRHEYRDEKADALVRLAGLMRNILADPVDNVVRLEARA